MSKVNDITGSKYGRLTVLSRAENNERGQTRWLCRCDCGNEVIVIGHSLISGNTMSCGCIHKERLAARNRANAKHGMRGSRLYHTWHNMKDRCLRKKHKQYHDYGGRGIFVCQEWVESFESFRDWALANGYRDDLSIDRIDNDGPYSPENCRWATIREQSNNRRNNHIITYNGESHTLKEWSELYDIPYYLLKDRIIKSGMPMEKALQKKDLRLRS